MATTYKASPGESLLELSRRFQISPTALAYANGTTKITSGDRIVVPTGPKPVLDGGRTTSTVTTPVRTPVTTPSPTSTPTLTRTPSPTAPVTGAIGSVGGTTGVDNGGVAGRRPRSTVTNKATVPTADDYSKYPMGAVNPNQTAGRPGAIPTNPSGVYRRPGEGSPAISAAQDTQRRFQGAYNPDTGTLDIGMLPNELTLTTAQTLIVSNGGSLGDVEDTMNAFGYVWDPYKKRYVLQGTVSPPPGIGGGTTAFTRTSSGGGGGGSSAVTSNGIYADSYALRAATG